MADSNITSKSAIKSLYERIVDSCNILVNKTDPIVEKEYTITINQPAATDCSITVTTLTNNEYHTATFKAKNGTPFKVILSGINASHYIPTITGGILNEDITIGVIPNTDVISKCSVIIFNDYGRNQVIQVKKNDGEFIDGKSYFAQPGDKAEFRLKVPNTRKFHPGILNTTSLDPIMKNINYVYATPPLPNPNVNEEEAMITLIQTPNQLIHFYTIDSNNVKTDHTSTFTAKIGDNYLVEVHTDPVKYSPGKPDVQDVYGEVKASEGIIVDDMIIKATDPQRRYVRVNINQSDHQTITVNTFDDNDVKTSYTSNFTIEGGTRYEVEIKADEYYIAGVLSSISGSFNDDLTVIKATAATDNSIMVTCNTCERGTYKVTVIDGGKEKSYNPGDKFRCLKGSSYTITLIPDIWYQYSTNIPIHGSFTVDTSIIATPSRKTDYEVTVTIDKMKLQTYHYGDSYGAAITGLWNHDPSTGEITGDITPLYVLDLLVFDNTVDNGTYKSVIETCFWGGNPVTDLFKTFTMDIETDNGRYQVCKDVPSSKFDARGDLYLYCITTDKNEFYNSIVTELVEYVKSHKGGKIKYYIHIDI